MKRLLLILAITSFVSSQSYAQKLHSQLEELVYYLKRSEYYEKQGNLDFPIKGSPYLTEEFEPSTLQLNGKCFEDIELRYDIYSDIFEVKLESEIWVINPVKSVIDSIRYNEEVFVRKAYDSGKNRRVAFMVFLGASESFSAYKQYKIKFKQATPAQGYIEGKPAEFKNTLPSYYVFYGGNLWEVKGTKSIASIFNHNVSVVKKYMRENHYRLNNEDELFEVFRYFSSL